MLAAAKPEQLPAPCSVSVIMEHCAAQEAQKDAASAFDDFMDQCIESDWARDREKLVHTIMPVGGTAKFHPNRQASLTATSNTLFLEAATGLLFHTNSQFCILLDFPCLFALHMF
jgi:hypothetical protein